MLWMLILFVPFCLANTETYLLRIPQHYDIPLHPEPIHQSHQLQRAWQHINSTHDVLLDYPIASINDELNPYAAQLSNVIVLPYDSTTQPSKTILVRLNNYNNTLFDGGDLLNVKLCWPATLPFDFRISHEYIKTKELIEESLDPAQLDLYLRIDYQFFGVTYDEKFLKSQGEVKFQLFVNKLPFKLIPIPLELYDFVVYLADLLILLLTQIKFLKRIFI